MAEQNVGRLVLKFGTYEEYMSLRVKDPNTLYFTTNPNLIYKGDVLYTESQAVKYMTETQYQELVRDLACNGAVIYLVVDDITSRLKYIYVGYVKIGQAGEDGSIGFPYTFPITF